LGTRECFQNVVCKFVTDTEHEGEDSHCGAESAGAEAVINDADLGEGLLVPPPALACDTSEHNDGENQSKYSEDDKRHLDIFDDMFIGI